jgi:hypothetical protein
MTTPLKEKARSAHHTARLKRHRGENKMAQQSGPQRSRTSSPKKGVSERIRKIETVNVELPLIGHVRMPPPDHLVFYGGLVALAAMQLVEWPLALVLGVGHALAESHHSRVAQELGQALDEA